MSIIRSLAAMLLLLATPALSAPYLGPDEPEGVRLNTSITITGPSVHLGDVFAGLHGYKDRVVTPAPRPGQRTVLTADFLGNLARTYSVDWNPSDQFDRVVVYRPGQTVTPLEMLAAVKADLALKGLPEHYGLKPVASLPTIVVPVDAVPPVLVREAFFDSATKAFSAVLEIAGADGQPQFMQLRGSALPTIAVPVLKEEIAHNAVITADMITEADVPENELKSDTVLDAAELLGKSTRGFVAPGRPIHSNDVVRLTLVDVPVLRTELRREGTIRETNIAWATMNAAELPTDVVIDQSYLIGKSPRSFVAAGAPIRRGDVLSTRQVAMAVASHDLMNGTQLKKDDINWVSVTDNEVETGTILDETQLRGRAVLRPVRAGQPLRAIDLVRPKVITRGKLVTMIYTAGTMKLTMQGEAMEDGGLAETIHVANAKSKNTVQAEVIDANTVKVTSQQPQQSAMQP